jgi:hypothetical protein
MVLAKCDETLWKLFPLAMAVNVSLLLRVVKVVVVVKPLLLLFGFLCVCFVPGKALSESSSAKWGESFGYEKSSYSAKWVGELSFCFE